MMSGDYNKAKEYYLEAMNIEASCTEALYNLGDYKLFYLFWYSFLAKEFYFDICGIFINRGSVYTYKEAYFLHLKPQRVIERKSLSKRSKKTAQKRINKGIHHFLQLFLTGLCYKRMGKNDEALECFHKLHVMLPSSSEVLCQLGVMYPLL